MHDLELQSIMTDDKDTMRLMKPPRNEEEAEAMLAALGSYVSRQRTVAFKCVYPLCLNAMVEHHSDDATDDATLTEYLSATDNTDPSIDGAAAITYVRNGAGVWQIDDGEALADDPAEYRVECSCGATFGNWGAATEHAEEQA